MAIVSRLRQVCANSQGLYDRGKDLNWKMVKGVQTLGAMGPPGGARNSLDPRLASLFIVFELEAPSLSSLKTIYNSILRAHCKNFAVEVQGGFQICNWQAPGGRIPSILALEEGVNTNFHTSAHHSNSEVQCC